RGRHAPADALRPPEVAIDRLLLQFLRREEIDVDQKSGVTLGEQARDDRATRKPAFAHNFFGALTRLGRGDATLIAPPREKQRCSGRVADPADLVQHLGPDLRLETALVNLVDQFRVHSPPPEAARRSAPKLNLNLAEGGGIAKVRSLACWLPPWALQQVVS